MRSRIAITALLALGALMSSGGAALGVSALSTSTTASEAQYGVQNPGAVQNPGVVVLDRRTTGNLPAGQGEGPAAGVPPQDDGVGDTQPDVRGVAPEGTTGAGPAQAPRQIAAGGASELPFTGYVAIPVLLLGLGLLAAGLTLRRGVRRSSLEA